MNWTIFTGIYMWSWLLMGPKRKLVLQPSIFRCWYIQGGYTHIWLISMLHVGKYTIHEDSMGNVMQGGEFFVGFWFALYFNLSQQEICFMLRGKPWLKPFDGRWVTSLFIRKSIWFVKIETDGFGRWIFAVDFNRSNIFAVCRMSFFQKKGADDWEKSSS